MRQPSRPLLGALALLLTFALDAQFVGPHKSVLGTRLKFTGPTSGVQFTHKLDVQRLASLAAGYSVNGCVGCCVDATQGHLWVTARQDANSPSSPHKLIEFYWDPRLRNGRGDWGVQVYDQPSQITASSWGIRDLAAGAGGFGRYIYGGTERSVSNEVWAFDVTKQPNSQRSVGWVPSANWKTDNVDSSIQVIRALAFHDARSTMFTADFNGVISEFRLDGTEVQTITPSRDWATAGMAYDPLRQTILACGQRGSNYPGDANAMVCYEFDPSLPGPDKETKTVFLSADLTIAASRIGGFSGGCDLHIERRRVETTTPGIYNVIEVPCLVWLSQAASDTVIQQYGRLQQYPMNGSQQATRTQTGGEAGMAGGIPFLGSNTFQVTLRGSSARSALLAMSPSAHHIRLPIGTILLNPNPAEGFVFGLPAQITGGRAAVALPVPVRNNLDGAVILFQWLEDNGTLSSAAGFKLVR